VGTCYNHTYWRGRAVAATLTSDQFALGSGLRVGAAAADLYARYPFIGIGSQTATVQTDYGIVTLQADLENDVVTALHLTVSNP
jgi:hypothetical protein